MFALTPLFSDIFLDKLVLGGGSRPLVNFQIWFGTETDSSDSGKIYEQQEIVCRMAVYSEIRKILTKFHLERKTLDFRLDIR